MAEVMTSPYIRTAVLKGLPYRQVILGHALRNALQGALASADLVLLSGGTSKGEGDLNGQVVDELDSRDSMLIENPESRNEYRALDLTFRCF